MKEIKIGNKRFTVHTSKHHTRENLDTLARYSGRDLFECYTKPSVTKIAIYKEWLQWAQENNVQYFGVCSHNSMTFSLQGMIEIDSLLYTLSITPSSNKAYIIG